MVKAVFVFALLGLIAVNSVSADDTLKCYVCEDCEEATGSKTCDTDHLFPSTTTTPTASSTTPSDSSTTPTGSGTDSTTPASTTTASTTPASTTPASTTTASTTPASTTPASTTTVSTTTVSTTTASTTTSTTPDPIPPNNGNPREDSTAATASPTKYKCFTITIDGKVKRGCTTTSKECPALETEKSGKDCNICDSENCNPASNIHSWAFTSVILLAIVKMFF